ncbi:MAG: DNA internalization-related competence protein ComEC/Rec2 [Candidatus Kryptoniota bacterium]
MFLISLSAGSILRRRGTLFQFGPLFGLLFSFAFLSAILINKASRENIDGYRYFAGTVVESPRDTLGGSFVIGNCFGRDSLWHRIDGEIIVYPSRVLNTHRGDILLLRGKVLGPGGPRNPNGFDTRSYYELSGIAGRIYVDSHGLIFFVRNVTVFNVTGKIVDRIRDYMRRTIKSLMRGEESELARAMVIGERGGIGFQSNEYFMNTGTIHILSVSGLHVGFLTGILMTVAAFLRIPHRTRFFVISPFLFLYGMIVGMTPSIERAIIMAVVLLFGIFLQRNTNLLNSLGFAALVILTFKPYELYSPGFQLSFAAVMSIVFFYKKIINIMQFKFPSINERPFVHFLLSMVVLSFAASLGTVPLITYYFRRISTVSLLANILIVPLAGLFTSMTFTFLLLNPLSSCAASIYASASQGIGFCILKVNELLGGFPFSRIIIADNRILFVVLYILWIVLTISFGGKSLLKKSVFGVLLGVDLILIFSISNSKPGATVYILDVGQGDSIFIELPDGRNLLIDAGMRFGKNDVGGKVVVPFLKRMGVERIDYFVVTHLHSDHMGGAASILKNFTIGQFLFPDQSTKSKNWSEAYKIAKNCGIRMRNVACGTILDSGNMYRIYVLHPNKHYVGNEGVSFSRKFNNGSIVLKIYVGKSTILLAGDVEKKVEHELMQAFGPFLRSDVLKVSHHGASTSSSEPYIGTVYPKYAVISVGSGNKFGHPSYQVIESLRRIGTYVWRTDSSGAAVFRTDGKILELVDWR